MLLDLLAGAEITYLPQEDWSGHEALAASLQEEYRGRGDKAHFIPTGASDEIGIWGYIAAWEELTKNFNDNGVDPEYVVVATGSGGTQAGLLVGAQMQKAKTKIVAFNVCDDSNYFQNKIKTDVSSWKQRYKTEFDETALNIKTFEGYMGPAYGEAEEIVFQTIANLAKVEGVFPDPVYTGKAFHGMVSELSLGDREGSKGLKISYSFILEDFLVFSPSIKIFNLIRSVKTMKTLRAVLVLPTLTLSMMTCGFLKKCILLNQTVLQTGTLSNSYEELAALPGLILLLRVRTDSWNSSTYN